MLAAAATRAALRRRGPGSRMAHANLSSVIGTVRNAIRGQAGAAGALCPCVAHPAVRSSPEASQVCVCGVCRTPRSYPALPVNLRLGAPHQGCRAPCSHGRWLPCSSFTGFLCFWKGKGLPRACGLKGYSILGTVIPHQTSAHLVSRAAPQAKTERAKMSTSPKHRKLPTAVPEHTCETRCARGLALCRL